jgi:hypothetical protein
VARFHLGNGARVERLNWAADPSAKGFKQSYGLMVNYLYDLKKLDKNRAALAQGKDPDRAGDQGPASPEDHFAFTTTTGDKTMQAPKFNRRDVLRAAAASAAVYSTLGHAQSVWPASRSP